MGQNFFTTPVIQLFQFIILFEINRFTILAESETTIRAVIGWPDDGEEYYEAEEEIQEIEWTVQKFSNIEDTLALVGFIRDNRLISIDKIILSPEELFEKIEPTFNWDKNQFDLALDTLLNIRVDMIDEGKKSDYFFVHF